MLHSAPRLWENRQLLQYLFMDIILSLTYPTRFPTKIAFLIYYEADVPVCTHSKSVFIEVETLYKRWRYTQPRECINKITYWKFAA